MTSSGCGCGGGSTPKRQRPAETGAATRSTAGPQQRGGGYYAGPRGTTTDAPAKAPAAATPAKAPAAKTPPRAKKK